MPSFVNSLMLMKYLIIFVSLNLNLKVPKKDNVKNFILNTFLIFIDSQHFPEYGKLPSNNCFSDIFESRDKNNFKTFY